MGIDTNLEAGRRVLHPNPLALSFEFPCLVPNPLRSSSRSEGSPQCTRDASRGKDSFCGTGSRYVVSTLIDHRRGARPIEDA